MLCNGFDKFRNLPEVVAATRAAQFNAYRFGTTSPLHLTHVLHLLFYFDPREHHLLDQFTLARGVLRTHAETADFVNSTGGNSNSVTVSTFGQSEQRRTFGSLGPQAAGQNVTFFPIVFLALPDPALLKPGQKSIGRAFHYDTIAIVGSNILDSFANATDMPPELPPFVPPIDYDWAGRFRRALSRQGRKQISQEYKGVQGDRVLTPREKQEREDFLQIALPEQRSELNGVWKLVLDARKMHEWDGPE